MTGGPRGLVDSVPGVAMGQTHGADHHMAMTAICPAGRPSMLRSAYWPNRPFMKLVALSMSDSGWRFRLRSRRLLRGHDFGSLPGSRVFGGGVPLMSGRPIG